MPSTRRPIKYNANTSVLYRITWSPTTFYDLEKSHNRSQVGCVTCMLPSCSYPRRWLSVNKPVNYNVTYRSVVLSLTFLENPFINFGSHVCASIKNFAVKIRYANRNVVVFTHQQKLTLSKIDCTCGSAIRFRSVVKHNKLTDTTTLCP